MFFLSVAASLPARESFRSAKRRTFTSFLFGQRFA
jgi:hypothetical protein